ncbi:MAG: Peptidase, family [Parcubacteria group bacterium]|nr:Peptidase, family [Parcubacteria group bacterium]
MPAGKRMSTYARKLTFVGITALTGSLLGALALFSPTSVQATWPFTSAYAADGTAPVLHDGSMHLLAAALNTDPNPVKGYDNLTLSDGSALLANGGPDGALPDASALTSTAGASADNSISVYTVKDGDSISGIADHFGVSVNTILWANGLTVRSTIRSGMSLVILPVSGVKHTVAKGETLSSIAAAFHASSDEVATFNGLDTDATVVVGSTLIIPGGEATAPSKPASSASTPAKTTTTTKTTTKTTASPTSSSLTKTTTTKTTSVHVAADLGSSSSNGGYLQNPVPGALLTQGIHGNNGVDLGAPSGTPIHAAAAGTVIISKNDGAWNGGYGSYVVISHSNGMQTLYAHMVKDIASVGETVSQGEVIGYVGETGEATGNHLHYEVRGGKNPLGYSCTEMSKCY